MKLVLLFLVFVSLCISTVAQVSRNELVVNKNGEVLLNQSLYHFKDSTNTLDIINAITFQKEGKFTPSFSLTSRQEFGYNTSPHWFYFYLSAAQKSDLMLKLEYANIDKLELYEVKNGEIRSLGLTGDDFLFYQRPYINNNYIFPIRLLGDEQAAYFLRINHPNAILSFSIQLWLRSTFLQNDRTEYLLWGIFIGIICLVLVINFVMLLATRDWVYLWYTLYVHFMTMHVFTDAGLSFQYLWQDSPVINTYMPVYLYVWAGMLAQTTFMQHFIHQNRHNSRVFVWINLFKGFVFMALMGAIAIRFFDLEGPVPFLYKTVSQLTSYFVIVIGVLTTISLYERRAEQGNMVHYYSYALMIQFLGYMVAAFINFMQAEGLTLALPADILTYIIIGLTLLFDIVFFSYGLAYRYSFSKQKNQSLQLTLLQTQQQTQQRIIDALEEERKRLAQDLHDDVGATLSTAKGYLSMLKRQQKTGEFDQPQQLLDEAAEELRNLSHQLMPKNFNKIGLSKAIEESVSKASGGRIMFDFVGVGKIQQLNMQTEILIFSTANEIIRKIEKYDTATEVMVQLVYHPQELNLSIEDNGQPIAENEWEKVKIKAAFLKTNLHIDSNSQGNTLILAVAINPTTKQ